MWQFLTVLAADSGTVLQMLSSLFLIVCCSVQGNYVSDLVKSESLGYKQNSNIWCLYTIWRMGRSGQNSLCMQNITIFCTSRDNCDLEPRLMRGEIAHHRNTAAVGIVAEGNRGALRYNSRNNRDRRCMCGPPHR